MSYHYNNNTPDISLSNNSNAINENYGKLRIENFSSILNSLFTQKRSEQKTYFISLLTQSTISNNRELDYDSNSNSLQYYENENYNLINELNSIMRFNAGKWIIQKIELIYLVNNTRLIRIFINQLCLYSKSKGIDNKNKFIKCIRHYCVKNLYLEKDTFIKERRAIKRGYFHRWKLILLCNTYNNYDDSYMGIENYKDSVKEENVFKINNALFKCIKRKFYYKGVIQMFKKWREIILIKLKEKSIELYQKCFNKIQNSKSFYIISFIEKKYFEHLKFFYFRFKIISFEKKKNNSIISFENKNSLYLNDILVGVLKIQNCIYSKRLKVYFSLWKEKIIFENKINKQHKNSLSFLLIVIFNIISSILRKIKLNVVSLIKIHSIYMKRKLPFYYSLLYKIMTCYMKEVLKQKHFAFEKLKLLSYKKCISINNRNISGFKILYRIIRKIYLYQHFLTFSTLSQNYIKKQQRLHIISFQHYIKLKKLFTLLFKYYTYHSFALLKRQSNSILVSKCFKLISNLLIIYSRSYYKNSKSYSFLKKNIFFKWKRKIELENNTLKDIDILIEQRLKIQYYIESNNLLQNKLSLIHSLVKNCPKCKKYALLGESSEFSSSILTNNDDEGSKINKIPTLAINKNSIRVMNQITFSEEDIEKKEKGEERENDTKEIQKEGDEGYYLYLSNLENQIKEDIIELRERYEEIISNYQLELNSLYKEVEIISNNFISGNTESIKDN